MTKAISVPRRSAQLTEVRLGDMIVNPVAQREFRPAHAERIRENFDPEQFTPPTVSVRDGKLYIVDGQHRTEAAKQRFGEDALVEVFAYRGLSEDQEAELFLVLNDIKPVTAMDKYRVAVTAGRPMECAINRIVRANGLRVGNATSDSGTVAAVTTLQRVFQSQGGNVLSSTLGIIRDSLGDGSYEAAIISGLAMVLARHSIDPGEMCDSLVKVRSGSKGLFQAAYRWREAVGQRIDQCMAAAIVEAYNKGRRGRAKLPAWFSDAPTAAAA